MRDISIVSDIFFISSCYSYKLQVNSTQNQMGGNERQPSNLPWLEPTSPPVLLLSSLLTDVCNERLC